MRWTHVALGCAAGAATLAAVRCWLATRNTRRLYTAIEHKRQLRLNSIDNTRAQYQQTPEDVRCRIHELEFDALSSALQDGKHTAEHTLHAYQEAACKAHERTNCITEFISEAADWARQLDALSEEERRSRPLFGLPFSVKEELAVKGYDSTWGFAQKLNQPKQETNLMVDILLELGAVPFVRTNVPQSLMSGACANPIYGRTVNAHNAQRVPGGSSGGCAALISLKGAVFGVGSDLGGSTRIPAHFSGIAGFKPTVERFSQYNGSDELPAVACVVSTYGVQGLSAHVIQHVIRALYTYDIARRDHYVVPVPWKNIKARPLRIGYYESDGSLAAQAACRRAVREAVQLLTDAGHTLVPVQLPDISIGVTHVVASAVDGPTLRATLDADIIEPDEAALFAYFGRPRWLRVLWARRHGSLQVRMMNAFADDVAQLRATFAHVYRLRNQVQALWKANELDALVCPASCSVALLPGQNATAFYTHSYTAIFNALHFSAGIVRLTSVTGEDVSECRADFERLSRPQLHDREMLRANGDDSAIALPVGVQVAAPPYNDEMVLHLMNVIEELSHNKQNQ